MLFDLDGTLTESKEGITKCAQYALAACGITVENLDDLTPFIGPTLYESFTTFYKMDEQMANFAVAKYRERFSTIGLFENGVYDGIPEMLSALREKGITLAVATGKPEVFAKRILDKYELSQYFKNVCGSELDGRRGKKAEVIDEVLDRIGVTDRSSVLMIGDRHHDIDAAKACGVASCGVRFGYGAPNELETAGADYIVDTVADLQALLLGL